eukprot:1192847-Prorocentrum_minimum.AAC.2
MAVFDLLLTTDRPAVGTGGVPSPGTCRPPRVRYCGRYPPSCRRPTATTWRGSRATRTPPPRAGTDCAARPPPARPGRGTPAEWRPDGTTP